MFYSFPLESDELILKKGMATLQSGDVTSIGALYLTTGRLVFVGYMRTAITSGLELEIPLVHIDSLNEQKTLYVLNNGVEVATIRGDRIRIIFTDRSGWLEAIQKQMTKL